jgi:Ni,Fe-hydrogenase I cytochrome b subunit
MPIKEVTVSTYFFMLLILIFASGFSLYLKSQTEKRVLAYQTVRADNVFMDD